MASEVLAVPEESLPEVIAVIRAGLDKGGPRVSAETRRSLLRWCEDEEDYLRRLSEDDDG